MGIAGKRILGDLQQLRLTPRGIAALTDVYLGVTGIIGVEGTAGKIHGFSIWGETAGTLVILAVQFAFRYFRCSPFAFVILLGKEDIAALGTCDAADFVSGSLGACGR